MKIKETSLTTVCAILVVFGAGALQFAVAIATISDPLVSILFCVTIVAVIIMDALVVHSIGNTPSNKVQKGVARIEKDAPTLDEFAKRAADKGKEKNNENR